MTSSEKDDQAEVPRTGEEAPAKAYEPRTETGQFTFIGHPVGLTVEGPPESPSGRRVESKPATGGVAGSHSDASGSTWADLQGPLARGRPNEAQSVKVVAQAIRARGESVRVLEGAQDHRGEDRLLEIGGRQFIVQVVSLPVDERFWRELAQTRQVQAHWSLEDAVGIVRAALDHKRGKSRGSILILDASHVGAMLSPRLVAAYSLKHGSIEAEYQVAECWIVGPTSRSAFRIP